MSHKKGIYIDGHECEDVEKYRKECWNVLHQYQVNHHPLPQCSDEVPLTSCARALISVSSLSCMPSSPVSFSDSVSFFGSALPSGSLVQPRPLVQPCPLF